MAKNKRPQTPKVGNRAMAKAFQEIRRSSAATPIPAKRGAGSYRRPKAGARGRDW